MKTITLIAIIVLMAATGFAQKQNATTTNKTVIENMMAIEKGFQSNWIDECLSRAFGLPTPTYTFTTVNDVVAYARSYFKKNKRCISLIGEASKIRIMVNLHNSNVKKHSGLLGVILPNRWNKVQWFDIEINNTTTKWTCVATLSPGEKIQVDGVDEILP